MTKTQKQGHLLKVMAKKELVKIETLKGEEPNSKIYIMSMSIKDLGIYEKAKATKRFMENETKVLEQVLDTDLRQVLRANGIIPDDGSQQALEKAFTELELKGKTIEIRDRYFEFQGEKIIGESPNLMTVIEEDGILSAAMEIIVNERITLQDN